METGRVQTARSRRDAIKINGLNYKVQLSNLCLSFESDAIYVRRKFTKV